MGRADVVEIVRRLKNISGLETVAMTTNGVTLARKLPALKEAGLDAINLRFNLLNKKRPVFLVLELLTFNFSPLFSVWTL